VSRGPRPPEKIGRLIARPISKHFHRILPGQRLARTP
jgi:hypothetical protein